jgi:hypothetical protein
MLAILNRVTSQLFTHHSSPACIRTLGAKAKVSGPGDISDLVEKFWTWHRCRRILWLNNVSGADVKEGEWRA